VKSACLAALFAMTCLVAGAVRGEIVEEIIAWVNGEIITLSEYQEEQQTRVAEIYKNLSGEELDREVERARRELLLNMIDRKILLHHARALGYDVNKMGEAYLKGFMKQQKIADEHELQRLAQQDGMSVHEIRERLLELYAPADVIDMEVDNRISVSEEEIRTFYQDNRPQFHVDGEVTIREIVLLAEDDAGRAARRDEAREMHRRALAAGDNFATLAREVSEAGTRDLGGRIGPIKRGELAPSLADLAFKLPVGAVSELVETPYGFHIVKVESRVDDHVRPLDEVRDSIRKQLQEGKFKVELDKFMTKARAESEWCVAPKHEALLSIEAPPPCDLL
jgi:parvulin-like peptidyl-prolyl isomerase